MEELSAKSNTCVATVVRFAKKLDYTGYLEMRKSLVSAAKKQYGRDEQLLQARPLFFREFNSSRMCHVAPQYQVRRCGI